MSGFHPAPSRGRSAFAARAQRLDALEREGRNDPALEARTSAVVARLRARIAAGRFTKAGLRRAFERLVSARREEEYDALDLLVAGLLHDAPVDEPHVALAPEMVAYQPTPARAALELCALLRPGEQLVDVGAGLGTVVLLVALLTEARAQGVELEPAYVAAAEQTAAALCLRTATFLRADAREAPLPPGALFFLYTPFRGALLAQFLRRVRGERLVTLGPCTAEVARTGLWSAQPLRHGLTLFSPRPA